MRWQPSLQIIPHYESILLYRSIIKSINKKISEIISPDLILASYHGSQKIFDKGDHTGYYYKTTRLINEKFNSIEIKMTFQSRFGPRMVTALHRQTLKSSQKMEKNVLQYALVFHQIV